jgi:nucleobase:cation symporter-1, NCS1 family
MLKPACPRTIDSQDGMLFPSMIDFKRGGYIAALIALVLYPFAPWEGSAASFVGVIGSTMGPIFGVIMVDYYLIRNGEIDVPEIYREEGVYRYTNGWKKVSRSQPCRRR